MSVFVRESYDLGFLRVSYDGLSYEISMNRGSIPYSYDVASMNFIWLLSNHWRKKCVFL